MPWSGRHRLVSSTGRGLRGTSLVFCSSSNYERRTIERVMSLHHGFRALWPVIFFLPWLLLGSVYLGGWAVHRLSSAARYGMAFPAGRLRIVGLGLLIGLGLLLITASVALAD